jgi:hypothetical protein
MVLFAIHSDNIIPLATLSTIVRKPWLERVPAEKLHRIDPRNYLSTKN